MEKNNGVKQYQQFADEIEAVIANLLRTCKNVTKGAVRELLIKELDKKLKQGKISQQTYIDIEKKYDVIYENAVRKVEKQNSIEEKVVLEEKEEVLEEPLEELQITSENKITELRNTLDDLKKARANAAKKKNRDERVARKYDGTLITLPKHNNRKITVLRNSLNDLQESKLTTTSKEDDRVIKQYNGKVINFNHEYDGEEK